MESNRVFQIDLSAPIASHVQPATMVGGLLHAWLRSCGAYDGEQLFTGENLSAYPIGELKSRLVAMVVPHRGRLSELLTACVGAAQTSEDLLKITGWLLLLLDTPEAENQQLLQQVANGLGFVAIRTESGGLGLRTAQGH